MPPSATSRARVLAEERSSFLRVLALVLFIPTLLSWPFLWFTGIVYDPDTVNWCAEADHRVAVTIVATVSPVLCAALLAFAWRESGDRKHVGVAVVSALIAVSSIWLGVLGVQDAQTRAVATSFSSCALDRS